MKIDDQNTEMSGHITCCKAGKALMGVFPARIKNYLELEDRDEVEIIVKKTGRKIEKTRMHLIKKEGTNESTNNFQM